MIIKRILYARKNIFFTIVNSDFDYNFKLFSSLIIILNS
jgi:hypothetical protein